MKITGIIAKESADALAMKSQSAEACEALLNRPAYEEEPDSSFFEEWPDER